MIDKNILQNVEKARKEGKKIGLVQGSWDMPHIGHLRYILEARKLCDYLVIGMDSDNKIRKRKGNSRPIIPESERYEFLKLINFADAIVIKQLDEPKWGLIKVIKPDVLIAIKDNYQDADIPKLEEICGKVAIIPRQSENSTSDYIRKAYISESEDKVQAIDEKVLQTIEQMKDRLKLEETTSEPVALLFQNLKKSTDHKCPVATGCFWNGKWHFGTNQIDLRIPKYDIENRTELFYSTVEHAEINMLKKLGEVKNLTSSIWTTLFPCDKCMKVLIDKGVKQIYYIEDHPERNWSKKSHNLAEKFNITTTQIVKTSQIIARTDVTAENDLIQQANNGNYKFIDPKNVRHEKQLEIMLQKEANGLDPLDPNVINQDILFETEYWYISQNRFPYDEIEHQFLIASKYPIYKLEAMNGNMWLDLLEVWEKLAKEYNISGGALCYRFGNTLYSGASLTRLHAHLISPKKGQKTKFTIGGNEILKKGLYLKDEK